MRQGLAGQRGGHRRPHAPSTVAKAAGGSQATGAGAADMAHAAPSRGHQGRRIVRPLPLPIFPRPKPLQRHHARRRAPGA